MTYLVLNLNLLELPLNPYEQGFLITALNWNTSQNSLVCGYDEWHTSVRSNFFIICVSDENIYIYASTTTYKIISGILFLYLDLRRSRE